MLSILLSFILHISALSAFFPKVLLAVAAAAVQQSAAAIVVIVVMAVASPSAPRRRLCRSEFCGNVAIPLTAAAVSACYM